MSIQDVTIKGREYIMKSGKYKGEVLGELLNIDANYVLMLHQKGYLTMQWDIIEEAKEKSTVFEVSKEQRKTTHLNDGRPMMQRKSRSGEKYNGWIPVKYKEVRSDSGYTVMLRLHNKEDIVVQKSRSILLKGEKKIYIEPKYYETDHKESVENSE